MRNKLGGDLMRAASRFAIVGMVGGLTAACSTDRFASSAPFSNPFASGGGSEPTRTGSISDQPRSPVYPRSSVHSQPLPPVSSAPISPPPSHGAMPSRPRTASGTAGWSTTGGTTVIVGPGETLTTLTSRYGVPGEAILSANGLTAGDVTAGRRVIIPVYSARSDSEPAPQRRVEASPPPVRYNAPPAPVAAAPAPAAHAGRVVASQKLEVKKAPPRTVAEAAPPKSQLRPGQVARTPEPAKPVARVAEAAKPPVRVVEAAKPAARAAEAKPTPRVAEAKPQPVQPAKVQAAKPEPKPAKVAAAAPKPVEKEVVLPTRKLAKVEAAKPVPAPKAEAPQKVAAAAPAKPAEPARAPVREPESTASIAPAAPVQPAAPSGSSDFRWPARGRVISGFSSGGNEGINIAVPEGTAVKAAGDGVVAYAGSEVKGYGNLVLIRHDNGYVSAYANNGSVDVKRGQRVTRGQSIAKSGQTGNVTSPQLHFEIRKGSTPVDPMKYLASAE